MKDFFRGRIKLINGWEKFHRFWSVRLAVLGTLITSVLIAFPGAALATWALMPQDMRSAIPASMMPIIGVAVFSTSVVARVIAQDDLE